MKAKVEIAKSFDNGKAFSKVWKHGDFEKFFREEGEYLDNLCKIADDKGKAGEKFTVTYSVTVEI